MVKKLFIALIAFSAFAETEKLTRLNQIESSLTDSHTTDTESPLSLLEQSTTQESLNIDKHWIGQTPYFNTLNRIQVTQIVFDALTAFPHKPQTSISADDRKNVIAKLYEKILRSQIDANTLENLYNIVQTCAKRDFTQTYLMIHDLSQKSLNCQAYWEGNKNNIYPTLKAIQLPATFTDDLPKSPDYPQKILCSTMPRKFNGFHSISQTAHDLKNRLGTLNCNYRSTTFAKTKRALCQSLALRYQQNSFIKALEEDPKVTTSLEDGQLYLERLDAGIANIQELAKALLILDINDTIPYTTPYLSFSSLYKSSDNNLPICPNSRASTPIRDSKRCFLPHEKPPTTNRDLYVEQLLGTQIIPQVIRSGLPLGMIEADDALYVLIAGSYQKLHYNKDLNVWRTANPTDKSNVLFLKNDQADKLKNLRNSILTDFYENRYNAQSQDTFTLFTKSVAIDIVNGQRKQNEDFIFYNNDKQHYVTRSTNALKESSEWRLRPDTGGWLDRISTMSNLSLLREIVILLAEIKQLQFLQLATAQKSLLLFAVQDALKTDIGSTDRLKQQIYTEVQNYLSGTATASDGIPLPPNDEENEAQHDEKNDEIVDLVEQYS